MLQDLLHLIPGLPVDDGCVTVLHIVLLTLLFLLMCEEVNRS